MIMTVSLYNNVMVLKDLLLSFGVIISQHFGQTLESHCITWVVSVPIIDHRVPALSRNTDPEY